MKIQIQNEKCLLIATKDDNIGRADAKIVSLISKINRALKGKIESFFHGEEKYDKDKVIVKFDKDNLEIVSKIVNLNGYAIIKC
jgi:hypothetical protein